ncbi:MAG: hypothetical protein AAGC55_06300 [Myxococcota bacterium]
MSNVRASTILARLRFVRERYGEQSVWELIDRLTPKHREILMAGMAPSSWVPFDFFVEVCVCADLMFGYGDLSLCYAMGRYAAAVNIPTFYRMFIRAGNPYFTMKRTSKIYSTQFDTGRAITMRRGDWAVLHIVDVDQPHRAHCLGILGWFTRAVEMAGSVVEEAFEVRCRTWGDPQCEMLGQWT